MQTASRTVTIVRTTLFALVVLHVTPLHATDNTPAPSVELNLDVLDKFQPHGGQPTLLWEEGLPGQIIKEENKKPEPPKVASPKKPTPAKEPVVEKPKPPAKPETPKVKQEPLKAKAEPKKEEPAKEKPIKKEAAKPTSEPKKEPAKPVEKKAEEKIKKAPEVEKKKPAPEKEVVIPPPPPPAPAVPEPMITAPEEKKLPDTSILKTTPVEEPAIALPSAPATEPAIPLPPPVPEALKDPVSKKAAPAPIVPPAAKPEPTIPAIPVPEAVAPEKPKDTGKEVAKELPSLPAIVEAPEKPVIDAAPEMPAIPLPEPITDTKKAPPVMPEETPALITPPPPPPAMDGEEISKDLPALPSVETAPKPEKAMIPPPPPLPTEESAPTADSMEEKAKEVVLQDTKEAPAAIQKNKDVDFSITFMSSETAVPLSVQPELDTLAEQMIADEKLRTHLTSYASGNADQPSTARRISLSRALAVRAYLIDKGVKNLHINVRAEGNKNPGGAPDRVDITVKTPEKK